MASRPKKIISILLVSIFLLSIFSIPLTALAQQQGQQQSQQQGAGEQQGEQESTGWLDWILGGFVKFSSGALLLAAGILGKMLGFFFSWLIYFFAWILDTTISGFNIVNAEVVKIGWKATRDLANMAFILALIIIAISTILRIKAFAAQQMLWRVIVAALLVNFSLIFGGIIVDASQMLAKFFVNAATGNNPAEFSLRLANAMSITAFYNPGPGAVNTIFKAVNQLWVAPVGIILNLVALVIMTFVFGAAAFFMLVRVIWLWILLIFSPFAWAALAFPGQSGQFNKWWGQLFHWAFFAPVFTFFMWLSLHLFKENGRLAPGVFSSVAPALGSKSIAYVEASAPEAIMQFALMTGLMVAALIVAREFGVYGAQRSLNMLQKWGQGAKNFAGRQLRRGYVAATKPIEPAAPPAGRLRRFGAAIGGVAVATPGLRTLHTGWIGAETKAYSDVYNQYKDIDPAVLQQTMQAKLIDPRTRTALQQILIEKGRFVPNAAELNDILTHAKTYGQEEKFLSVVKEKLADKGQMTAANGYDEAAITNIIQRAQKYNKEKDFFNYFPAAAARALGKSVEDIVRKVDKASDIYLDQLTDEVRRAFNVAQMKDVSSKGSSAVRAQISQGVMADFNALTTADQTEINRVSAIRDKRRREDARAALPENQRRLSYSREIINTPQWEAS